MGVLGLSRRGVRKTQGQARFLQFLYLELACDNKIYFYVENNQNAITLLQKGSFRYLFLFAHVFHGPAQLCK